MYTPWGQSQDVREIVHGVTVVSTASHGGIHLSEDRMVEFREHFPNFKPFAGEPWFEEDCDTALVVLAFADHFTDEQVHAAVRAVRVSCAYFTGVGDWLDTTKEGASVSDRAQLFAHSVEDMWERGGMSSGIGLPRHMWEVWFHRGEETRTVVMPYPDKHFYSTDELDAFCEAA